MEKFQRVLLVDDDDVTNYINQNLLEEMALAYHIDTYTEAEEALRLVEQHCPKNNCPDLIFLDLKMPVFDGFDFLKGFKMLPDQKTQGVQVVVLTSSNNPKDLRQLKELGIETLVNKPLTQEKILTLFQ